MEGMIAIGAAAAAISVQSASLMHNLCRMCHMIDWGSFNPLSKARIAWAFSTEQFVL
jgi:cytochrome c5